MPASTMRISRSPPTKRAISSSGRCVAERDRHRRNRDLGPRLRPPAPPPPRHHRVRGRRPRRRPHQHRSRRARPGDGTRRTTSTPASSSTTSATTRTSSRLLDQLGVATQPERDELQRQRPAHRTRVPGHQPQHALRPAGATWPSPGSTACWSTSCGSTAPARRLLGRRAGDAGVDADRLARATSSRDGRYSDALRRAVPRPARARRSGRPTPRPSPGSPPWPTPGSWTTTACSSCAACRSGARSPAGRSATSTRSPRRSPTASASARRSRKIVRRHAGDDGIEVELMSPSHGPETFDRVILATPQRPGAAAARRRRARPSARSSAPSATSPTWRRCTPTSGSCPRTARARASWNYHLGAGAGRAGHADLLDEPPAVARVRATSSW